MKSYKQKFRIGDTVRTLIYKNNLGQTIKKNTIGTIVNHGTNTHEHVYIISNNSIITFLETELELIKKKDHLTDLYVSPGVLKDIHKWEADDTNSRKNVMKVARASKPKLVQSFENLLWANSPKDWIFKSIYYHKTLFVSILIEIHPTERYQKIRRSFGLDIISSRSEDLFGLAADCIDEMKTEVKN